MDMLIADDHIMYRQLLRPLLASAYPDATIAEAADYLQVCATCSRHQPRLLILDVFMPGMNSLAGVHEIIRLFPDMHVLICSAIDNPILVRTMLAFGARGYVSKTMPTDRLLEGIDAVLNDATYVPEDSLMDTESMHLTNRQWEILGMLCMGLTNKEIARRLDLSISTVKFHVGLILETLHVQSRQQAIASCRPI